ncbi:MAG: stage V sporulation protein T [Oscillospiraceae bacterium]
MKATGIVRRIDDLGRIVIPKEIRRTMRIHEGDPLEIYTESDGTVIFKKYSPIGELGEFAMQYAEALAKALEIPTCITDKDNIIAVSGVPKKDLRDKKISSEIEKIIAKKAIALSKNGEASIKIIEDNETYTAGVVAPIIFDGDGIGTVIFLTDPKNMLGEMEIKLAETAAGFLGKTME